MSTESTVPSSAPRPSPRTEVLHWTAALVWYLALACVLTWPLVVHLQDLAVGYPSPDNMDTAQLRRVVAMGLEADGTSLQLFPPVGYNARALMPNQLDHWLAAPLVRVLPWPLADNIWWLAVLTLNGLAGHLVGRSLGGSHRAGVLCGVAFACAEPILREANMGHAPQAMAFSGPLVVWALARSLAPDGTWRHAVGLGAAMALAGVTYWYFGMFFAALCVPVVAAAALHPAERPGVVRVGLGAVVCLLLAAVPAWLAMSGWDDLAMTDRALLPPISNPELAVLPASDRFIVTQSGGLDWAWESMPPDRSNRLSLAVVVAAMAGTFAASGQRLRWWLAAGVGGILLMGPFLAYQGSPVLLGERPIALPWYWISHLSPVLERLHWLQRWGIVVPLALLPLLARTPRPLVAAAFVLAEALLVSHHAPLLTMPTTQFDGWRPLATLPDDRSVLVLPIQEDTDHMAILGLAYRAAEQPLIAPMRLPGGARAPIEWQKAVAPLNLVGRKPTESWTVDVLREQGIGAVVVDATPGGKVHPDQLPQLLDKVGRMLEPELGPPEDHGSVLVWWVDPPESATAPLESPDSWREDQFRALDVANRAMDASPHAAMRWSVPHAFRTRPHPRGKR